MTLLKGDLKFKFVNKSTIHLKHLVIYQCSLCNMFSYIFDVFSLDLQCKKEWKHLFLSRLYFIFINSIFCIFWWFLLAMVLKYPLGSNRKQLPGLSSVGFFLGWWAPCCSCAGGHCRGSLLCWAQLRQGLLWHNQGSRWQAPRRGTHLPRGAAAAGFSRPTSFNSPFI